MPRRTAARAGLPALPGRVLALALHWVEGGARVRPGRTLVFSDGCAPRPGARPAGSVGRGWARGRKTSFHGVPRSRLAPGSTERRPRVRSPGPFTSSKPECPRRASGRSCAAPSAAYALAWDDGTGPRPAIGGPCWEDLPSFFFLSFFFSFFSLFSFHWLSFFFSFFSCFFFFFFLFVFSSSRGKEQREKRERGIGKIGKILGVFWKEIKGLKKKGNLKKEREEGSWRDQSSCLWFFFLIYSDPLGRRLPGPK